MKLLTALRHKRGFGIHSPFAFRFITETLCLPRGVRYYAEAAHPRDRVFRVVHRTVAALQPRTAYVYTRVPGSTVGEAVHLADSRIVADNNVPDLLIADIAHIPDDATLADLRRMASTAKYLIVIVRPARSKKTCRDNPVGSRPGRDDLERVADAILGACTGMTFTNGRGIHIKVTRPDLPHQTFLVRF